MGERMKSGKPTRKQHKKKKRWTENGCENKEG